MDKANYNLITLARESEGLTQSDLAEKINVEQSTISKIENGLLDANETEINKISEVLDYPKIFFYQDWNPIRVEGFYRRKLSLPAKELKECKAKMTFAEKHFSILIESLEMPVPDYPKWDVEIDGSPMMCARYVREYWKMPKGRVANVTELLEDKGFIIIELDLDGMDGFSTFSESNFPIIFVNRNMPGDRDIFTKTEEAFHFIMHHGQKISPERDIEKEVKEAVSEFLVPLKEIESQLFKLNIPKLTDLKQYWNISMAALIAKAKNNQIITNDQYKYIWKQMVANGYRIKEPVEIKRQKPSLFTEIFESYFEDLNYSKTELCNLLKISENKLDSWYLGKRNTRFKVIK